MQFTTSEKDTISLNKLYFSNYTILTSGFNVIFDGKIPDGVIVNNDLMLIIESKRYTTGRKTIISNKRLYIVWI